jgi:pyruvate-formate lyase-activating enzyme
MRRSEFNDPEEFRKVKAMMLDLKQPEAILYEQLATGDQFQVLKNVNEYRQSGWAGDTNRQPGPWMTLEP